MQRAAIATLLCVGAIAAAACGEDSDDIRAGASGRDGDPSALEPARAEVPDVIGQQADEAGSTLEAAGFEPSFDPEPDDSRLCTVSDQDQTGEVERGAEVILTLECTVDVPDLSDEPAEDAVSRLEDLGLTASYEAEPDDLSVCTVEDQDVVGEAEPNSEVVLSLICRLPNLTGKDLPTAVADLDSIGYAAHHPSAADPRACTVTSHRTHAEPGARVGLGISCRSLAR